MKTPSLIAALTLAFATTLAASAQAQSASDAPRTRAEVRAETAAAIRDGDIPSGYDGLTMKQLMPTMYAHDAARRARAVESAQAQVAAASSGRKTSN